MWVCVLKIISGEDTTNVRGFSNFPAFLILNCQNMTDQSDSYGYIFVYLEKLEIHPVD